MATGDVFRRTIEWQIQQLKVCKSNEETIALAATLTAYEMKKHMPKNIVDERSLAAACSYIAQEMTEPCAVMLGEWARVAHVPNNSRSVTAGELLVIINNVLHDFNGDVLLKTSVSYINNARYTATPISNVVRKLAMEAIVLCLPNRMMYEMDPAKLAEGAIDLVSKRKSVLADLVSLIYSSLGTYPSSVEFDMVTANYEIEMKDLRDVKNAAINSRMWNAAISCKRMQTSIQTSRDCTVIASGKNSKVVQSRDRNNNLVAVKLQTSVASMPLEIALMTRFSHENVQDIIGFSVYLTGMCMWMSLAKHNLDDAISYAQAASIVSEQVTTHLDIWQRDVPSSYALIPEHLRLSYARQIAAALEYMHSMGVIHCDLKPKNILIYPNNHIKVCDFGLSIPCHRKGSLFTAHSIVCTITHRDINLLRAYDFTGFSFEVDVWSLGIVMTEMETGCNPLDDEAMPYYYDSEALTIMEKSLNACIGEEFGSKTLMCVGNETTREIIKHALDYDRVKRWSAAEVAHGLREYK